MHILTIIVAHGLSIAISGFFTMLLIAGFVVVISLICSTIAWLYKKITAFKK